MDSLEMEMNPFFGIVVACYNSERFIPRLVESLKVQTFQGFNVMFVDDASTDDTGDAIVKEHFPRRLGWNWVKLKGPNNYFEGENGMCWSAYYGGMYVKGQYLWFIHGDTWLESDCLQKLYDYILATGTRFLTARELRYDSNEDIHAPLRPHGACAFDLFGNPVNPPVDMRPDFRLLYGGNLNCFERELFDRIQPYDTHMKVCFDEEDNAWRCAIAGEKAGYAVEARIHHWLKDQKSLKDFETNRQYRCVVNHFYTIAKNAQHVLLLMLPAYAMLQCVESLVLAILCRKPFLVWWLWLRPIRDTVKDWRTILERRREIRAYRVHGDWWFMRHYIRFTFGHWHLVKKLCRKVLNEYKTNDQRSTTEALQR